MAETPFTPDPGAAGGGRAPEAGNPGSPAQVPAEAGSPSDAGPGASASEPASGVAEPAAVGASEPGGSAALPGTDVIVVTSPQVAAPLPSSPEPAIHDLAAAAPAAAEGSGAAPLPPAAAPAVVSEPPAAQPPGVAATIAVPPLEEGESGGGGEWELLVERISAWWHSGELNRQWQRIRGPLKGVALLVALLLALQVYSTVVRTIDALPVVSGLLELVGLIALLQFSASRLLRSSDRQEVIAQLQRRWLDFRGRS